MQVFAPLQQLKSNCCFARLVQREEICPIGSNDHYLLQMKESTYFVFMFGWFMFKTSFLRKRTKLISKVVMDFFLIAYLESPYQSITEKHKVDVSGDLVTSQFNVLFLPKYG